MKLKSIVLSAAALLSAVAAEAAAPRYVFYMIGDGMGPGAVMAAQTYNRMTLGNSEPLTMMQFPVSALCTTYSASSPVTDSAAAGTALACGVKTNNNMLGMTPDSVAVSSMADRLKEMGFGVALVTNVAPDDATPAAFYAHAPYRAMFHQIGLDAARSKVDFLAGSNLRGTRTKGKYNGLYEEFAANGMEVTRSMDRARNTESRRVLLLDADTLVGTTGHAIDCRGNENNLPAVTDLAIHHMNKVSPDRFFVMVEGGNIDWAGHANDGATIVKEVLCFDQALARAYEFYLQHPDETLIVVTADHETGGLSVGQRSTGYNCYTDFVDCQRVSKDSFSNWCQSMIRNNTAISWPEMKQYLAENLSFWDRIPVSEEVEQRLEEKFNRTFVTRNDNVEHSLYNDFPEFSQEVFDIVNRRAGFGFTTGNHSGNPVPVFAIGAGAELFGGMNYNTD
ncbi:MAG: alkaline phosphatase, partial [Muribaculaceae bacterium]|nr:alkaline phosphatase [Muribaculaceae bacterium]